MRFYGLSYEEMLALPIKMFWFMNAQIDRINAQHDMRALEVTMCSQSGEMAVGHHEKLVLEVGTVVTLMDDPLREAMAEKDSAGIAELKAMTV
jgi:hypothetical protein